MAVPVFFIKEKDSSLQLAHNYKNLNVVIVKNRYSLLLISKLVFKLQGI